MLLSALVQGDDAELALVRSDGRGLTYAALREAAEAGGGQLTARGLGLGDVIGVAIADPAGFLLAALGVWKTGAALLPLDVRGGAGTVAETASRAKAAAVITGLGPDLQLVIESGTDPARVDERTGMLLFTSGSSGKPKGVLLGRDGIVANVEAICGYLPLPEFPRTAVVLPLVYSYALVGQALTTLHTGGTLVLLGDVPFPKTQLELMVAQNVSGLSAVPTSLRLLSRTCAALEPKPALALGYVASAGGPLDAATVREARAAFNPRRFFNQYGLTEASPRVTAVSDLEPQFDSGSVGRPLPGLEVRVGDGGVLEVRGPSVMLGYLGDAAPDGAGLTVEGWLRTGDLGRVDADGYVFVEGRADSVVKVAGERVGLDEVAATLRQAAGVDELFVIGIPDDVLGTRLVAALVGAEAAVGAVRELARQKLAPARRPSKVLRLEVVPKTANGKCDLPALSAVVREGLLR